MLNKMIMVDSHQAGNFIYDEQPIQPPSGHDLLIEVKAIAFNPLDTKVRSNPQLFGLKEPLILGWDACGIVVAKGEKASQFAIGDAVWYAGSLTRAGCNATHQLVDARIVAHKPNNLNWAQAAAMPLTALTAWEGLFSKLKIDTYQASQTLLIIGGAGGVGSLAIPLAKLRSSVKIIATASQPASQDWCYAQGADLVVDYHNLQDNLRSEGIEQVDAIFCLHNIDPYWPTLTELIAPFGEICSIVPNQEPLQQDLLRYKSASLHWELMFTHSMYQTAKMYTQGEILQQVAQLVEQGRLNTTLTKTLYGLTIDNIQQGHQAMLQGHMQGKLVIEL